MKVRKARDIVSALERKGFHKVKEKEHHKYYFLYVNEIKTNIYTYISHGKKSKDYGKKLMNKIKNQLKFDDSNIAEDFFDCPFTKEMYVEMLKKKDLID